MKSFSFVNASPGPNPSYGLWESWPSRVDGIILTIKTFTFIHFNLLSCHKPRRPDSEEEEEEKNEPVKILLNNTIQESEKESSDSKKKPYKDTVEKFEDSSDDEKPAANKPSIEKSSKEPSTEIAKIESIPGRVPTVVLRKQKVDFNENFIINFFEFILSEILH